MVVGARSGEHYRESLIKMPLRRRACASSSSSRPADLSRTSTRDFRVFHRATILEYYDHLCDTFSFTTSMTLAYMMTGKFVAYVPIDYNKRVGKSKVRLLRNSMKTLQYIIEAAIYYNPLKMFMLMACIVAMASIVSFVLALVAKLNVFFYVGVGGIISAVIVFSLGTAGGSVAPDHAQIVTARTGQSRDHPAATKPPRPSSAKTVLQPSRGSVMCGVAGIYYSDRRLAR